VGLYEYTDVVTDCTNTPLTQSNGTVNETDDELVTKSKDALTIFISVIFQYFNSFQY